MLWIEGSFVTYSSIDNVDPRNVPNCTNVSWHWSYNFPTSFKWLFSVSLYTTQYLCWAIRRHKATAKFCSASASFNLCDDFFVFRTWLKYPASPFKSSPPAIASSCSGVISSAASIPAIFCTISFKISRSKLFCAFSWLATYCNSPVSSMLYFLKMAPQKEARLCSHKEIDVPSCLKRSRSADAKDSMRQ